MVLKALNLNISTFVALAYNVDAMKSSGFKGTKYQNETK